MAQKLTVRQLGKELRVHEHSVLEFLHTQGFNEYKFSTVLDNEMVDLITSHRNDLKVLKDNEVILTSPFTVKDVAQAIKVKPHKLVEDFVKNGIFASINQTVDEENVEKILKLHKITPIFQQKTIEVAEELEDPIEQELLSRKTGTDETRIPVVTILGHVDHGKTTLLDALRNSNISDNESGKITQHVGAYTVDYKGNKISFLDTPGHSAFSAMRKRGVIATDIVLIIIAADDGVNKQTKECIELIRNSSITTIFVLNKIDLPTADENNTLKQLQAEGILTEEWGGEYGIIKISAKNKTGLDELIERVQLEAEVSELKAQPNAVAEAIIVESQIETGLGPTSHVIIQNGTLKVGDSFICGQEFGKIKNIVDDLGNNQKFALPGYAVKVSGFSGTPEIGAKLITCKNEREAKKIAEERQKKYRTQRLTNKKVTSVKDILSELSKQKKEALNIIIKADVNGSLEAILSELRQIPSEKIELNILKSEIGPINNNDIEFASSCNAEIIGFHVRKNPGVSKLAERKTVKIQLMPIIYQITDYIEEAMTGLVKSNFKEEKLGSVRILEIFKIKNNKICGSLVTKGTIKINAYARVYRDKDIIYNGNIKSLRRFKDNVKEVQNGFECGIDLDNFNDFEKEDIIEVYELKEVKGTL